MKICVCCGKVIDATEEELRKYEFYKDYGNPFVAKYVLDIVFDPCSDCKEKFDKPVLPERTEFDEKAEKCIQYYKIHCTRYKSCLSCGNVLCSAHSKSCALRDCKYSFSLKEFLNNYSLFTIHNYLRKYIETKLRGKIMPKGSLFKFKYKNCICSCEFMNGKYFGFVFGLRDGSTLLEGKNEADLERRFKEYVDQKKGCWW